MESPWPRLAELPLVVESQPTLPLAGRTGILDPAPTVSECPETVITRGVCNRGTCSVTLGRCPCSDRRRKPPDASAKEASVN